MVRKKSTLKLNVIQKGSGEPVLLIHPFPLTSASWKSQMNTLAQFSRVICPDLPGFGKSPRIAKPTIALMAKSIAAKLTNLKINKPVFVAGISMGGYVALEFVRQFPARVRGLALMATRAGADTREQKKKRHALAAQVRAEGLTVISEAVLPKLVAKKYLKKNPAVLKSLKAMLQKSGKDGVADALIAMAKRRNMNPFIKKIKCPVLIVSGTADEVIPASESEAMHDAIPLSRLRLIEGAGHLVNLEHPAAVNDLLAQFVRALS